MTTNMNVRTTIKDKHSQTNWHWQHHSFKAMNTNVYIRLYSQTTDDDILFDVQRLFASFEKRLSRFDPASELSRVNNEWQDSIRISPTLLNAMEVALWAAEITGGLYDPTILANLEEAGYDRSFEKIKEVSPLKVTSPSAVDTCLAGVSARPFNFRSIQLNRAKREIYKPVGVGLDLGGMGKGWTVDRAADRLQGLGPFLINAGGDIFGYQAPPGQTGWEIDLIHPLKPEQFIARVYLQHRALATSTIARRRWQRNGQMMHHLIDPRTGQPAHTNAISVSVIADRTMTAEIYAKVVLILGAEQGLTYLQNMPGVEGLIYTDESQILYTRGLENILDRLETAGYHN